MRHRDWGAVSPRWAGRGRDRAGDFAPQAPSSAARPGLRRFFDFSGEGWRGDGVNQRPPAREQYR